MIPMSDVVDCTYCKTDVAKACVSERGWCTSCESAYALGQKDERDAVLSLLTSRHPWTPELASFGREYVKLGPGVVKAEVLKDVE